MKSVTEMETGIVDQYETMEEAIRYVVNVAVGAGEPIRKIKPDIMFHDESPEDIKLIFQKASQRLSLGRQMEKKLRRI